MSAPPKYFEQLFVSCVQHIKYTGETEEDLKAWTVKCANFYGVATQLVNKGMVDAAQVISRMSEE